MRKLWLIVSWKSCVFFFRFKAITLMADLELQGVYIGCIYLHVAKISNKHTVLWIFCRPWTCRVPLIINLINLICTLYSGYLLGPNPLLKASNTGGLNSGPGPCIAKLPFEQWSKQKKLELVAARLASHTRLSTQEKMKMSIEIVGTDEARKLTKDIPFMGVPSGEELENMTTQLRDPHDSVFAQKLMANNSAQTMQGLLGLCAAVAHDEELRNDVLLAADWPRARDVPTFIEALYMMLEKVADFAAVIEKVPMTWRQTRAEQATTQYAQFLSSLGV